MSSEYYSQVRREMLQFVPLGVQDVLDVGCGEGLFGELLQKERGCRVTGLEPCAGPFEAARKRLYRAVCATLEDFLSSCRGNFDAICFNDVLEHLVDPWAQLKACRRLLTSRDGVVVASIPNIRFYYALKEILLRRDFPYQDFGIFDRTHLRFFTRQSLCRMFRDSGY